MLGGVCAIISFAVNRLCLQQSNTKGREMFRIAKNTFRCEIPVRNYVLYNTCLHQITFVSSRIYDLAETDLLLTAQDSVTLHSDSNYFFFLHQIEDCWK